MKKRIPRIDAERKESWTYCAVSARCARVGGLRP